MRSMGVLVAVTVSAGLACAGVGGEGAGGLSMGGGAAPAHGSVAYQTYVNRNETIRFRTETETTKTWRNMDGKPVPGTYTHVGAEIVLLNDPSFDNQGIMESRFRQLDECSIAEYYQRLRDGTVKDNDSRVFQRTEPKCPKAQ